MEFLTSVRSPRWWGITLPIGVYTLTPFTLYGDGHYSGYIRGLMF